jgi:hypothetical protein
MNRVWRHIFNLVLQLLLNILVASLIGGNLIQHCLQSTLSHMNFALIFPLLLFPVVLVPPPQLMYPIRVLFLTSNFLLGSLQTSSDLGCSVYSLISLPREFREG